MNKSENKVTDNLSILILSCQKFSDLWSNNLLLFEKYWKEHPAIFLSSDGEGIFDLRDFDNLIVVKDDMSSRIIKAVNTIKSKYIFLTFDDYYLKSMVKAEYIKSVLKIMDSEQYDYCRFFKEKKIIGKEIGYLKYKKIPLKDAYEVNFYPSIWKKESLLKVLKFGEDIWKTEVRLTRRMRENGLSGIAVYDKSIFPFADIVRKGKYLKSGYRFLKKNHLFISNREIRSFKETVSLFIQTIASNYLPKCIKKTVKNRMRKKGKIFYSDYEYDE